MSNTAGATNVPPSSTASSKGKKNKKKKGGGGAAKANGNPSTTANGVAEEHDETRAGEHEGEAEAEVEDENTNASADTPADSSENTPKNAESSQTKEPPDNASSQTTAQPQSPTSARSHKRTFSKPESAIASTANGEDTSARLEALAQERTALRDEVASLRKELEQMQELHGGELSKLRAELDETRSDKDKAETNYNNLRDRVGTIRSQLGQRLKEDAEELATCRSRIEELEDENAGLKSKSDAREEEVTTLAKQVEDKDREIATLRSRSNLSSQNWTREKEELLERESSLRAEFDGAKQAMQDWEILAMEERSIRENLGERVEELEEQLTTHREAHERLESERATQAQTVDGLQRALRELQEARKTELREVVENSQAQLESLRKELEEANTTASAATSAKESTAKELERLQPLEAELKEKNLIIGKLRHQAVGLNEHLTRALQKLKRGKPEDNVDRELVTNHFLHFLALERSDPKKFQILQIISSILNWTDEQREQAGLARPGASNPSLRTPISPWNRTPSTPSLSELGQPERGRNDSVGGAFAEFLERESDDGTHQLQAQSQHSRSTSQSESRK